MDTPTPIKRWKDAHGLTYKQVASVLGITVAYARQLGCKAAKRTSPRLAEQIEERSGGEIRREELVFPDRGAAA